MNLCSTTVHVLLVVASARVAGLITACEAAPDSTFNWLLVEVNYQWTLPPDAMVGPIH